MGVSCSRFALSTNSPLPIQYKLRHLHGYVLVYKRNLKDVPQTRVMPTAECCIHYRLVRSMFELRFKPKLKNKRNSAKKLNVGCLLQEDVKAIFQADLQKRLSISLCTCNSFPDTLWEEMKSATLRTSADFIGHTKRKTEIGLIIIT